MTRHVVSVKPRDSAGRARGVMEEHRINQLPVLEGTKLVGIVTDRDLRDAFPSVAQSIGAGAHVPKGADPTAIPVEDVMSHEVMTVAPETPLADATRLMRKERIGALPVVRSGHLVGILTRSDLLGALIGLLDAP